MVEKLAYSLDEACALVGLGKTKLYESINDGRLRARKCGKRTMVLRSDLQEFLSNLEVYSLDKDAQKGGEAK